jgi:hypothetical protein
MENYKVVTNDGEEVGHVVGQVDGSLIVESGLLRKTRHAIPESFAHVDDEERTVCVTISKNVIEDSPKIENGEPDPDEVARYYGLAGGFEAPETGVEGEMEPDDPAKVHGRRPTADDPAGLGAGDPD